MYTDDTNQSDLESEIEPVNEDGERDQVTAKLDKLRDKLNTCETEKSEYLLGWQRERADFANWKKDVSIKNQEEKKFMIARVIEDLLPVLDSMEKAKSWSADLGFVQTQMEQVLSAHGLARYGDKGEMFDPNLHEAVGEALVERREDSDKVIEIVSPGYKLGDKVIKAAQVKVGIFSQSTN
jgi:molecular chaperone GrpE